MQILRSLLAGAAVLLAAAAALAQSMTAGEIRKVDAAGGRVTLNHGEIKNLDMPPMNNMVFKVQDPKLLATLKPGDQILFTAEKLGGSYTITQIRRP